MESVRRRRWPSFRTDRRECRIFLFSPYEFPPLVCSDRRERRPRRSVRRQAAVRYGLRARALRHRARRNAGDGVPYAYCTGVTGNKKIPDNCLSRTKKLPRCHLASRFDPCPLRSACTLPATDVCPPSRHTRFLSRAPSAVHLMYRFPPGSQLPGLSVEALYTFISASTVLFGCTCYTTRQRHLSIG